jgi:hypothetical protein
MILSKLGAMPPGRSISKDKLIACEEANILPNDLSIILKVCKLFWHSNNDIL